MINYKDIADLFSELEVYLIRSLKRNLQRHKEWEADEGFDWTAWQAEKIRNLNKYRKQNKKIAKYFLSKILPDTKQLLQEQYAEYSETDPSFFKMNNRRMDALIKEMTTIEETVTKAAVRNMDDVYRQTISKAALALNSGTMTLNQAVDLATKDFLNKGINCVQYKDGRRVNIASYAEMALRTNATRAQLLGMGEKMKQLGVDTVLVSQYGGCSPTCLPWQGKVYINDVFMDFEGKKGVSWGVSRNGREYMLLSYAVENGLFHPNCRHHMGIYTEGITRIPPPLDEETVNRNYSLEQQQRAMERQIRLYKRLEAGTLDEVKKQSYTDQRKLAQTKLREFINENSDVLRRDLWRERLVPHSEEDNIALAKDYENRGTAAYRAQDSEQYERYRKAIWDIAPDSLEDFTKIKYNDSEQYGKLKHAYRIANQYENNSGNMAPSKIVELHDFAVDCKAKLTGKARKSANIGVMEFDGEVYIASSQINNVDDPAYINYGGDKSRIIFSPLLPSFHPFQVGKHPGEVDSEYKFFEFASIKAADGKKHSLRILSEKNMCKSCRSVMNEFMEKHSNVAVEVVSHREDRAEKNKNRNRIFEIDVKLRYKDEDNR